MKIYNVLWHANQFCVEDDLWLYNLCDKKSVLQAIETWIYNTPYTQYKVAENYDL